MQLASPKAIIYCRKSTESEDCQILSIESQIDECKKLAEKHGITNYKIIKELKTARSPGRPLFMDMLNFFNTKKYDTLLCWKLDRLSRNPIDGATLISLLEYGYIQKIITSTNVYLPQDNHVLMYVEFGMAAQYSRDLSTNVKRGLTKKIDSGWLAGPAPIGYLNNPDRSGPPIIKDPIYFALIQKMWKMLISEQYSPAAIFEIINQEIEDIVKSTQNQQIKKISRTSAYRIFRNPFYYGYIKRGENESWGKHPPMITETEYNFAETILNRKGSRKKSVRKFPYRGLLACGECGCGITIEESINRYGTKYIYYHCTKKRNSKTFSCSQKVIQIEKLEAQLVLILKQINITTAEKQAAISYLNKIFQDEKIDCNRKKQFIKRDLAQIYNESNDLAEQNVNKKIQDTDLAIKAKYLQEKEKTLMAELEILEKPSNWLHPCIQIFEFTHNIYKKFQKAKIEEKNKILQSLGSNFILMNGQLSFKWFKPIEIFYLRTADNESQNESTIEMIAQKVRKQVLKTELINILIS